MNSWFRSAKDQIESSFKRFRSNNYRSVGFQTLKIIFWWCSFSPLESMIHTVLGIFVLQPMRDLTTFDLCFLIKSALTLGGFGSRLLVIFTQSENLNRIFSWEYEAQKETEKIFLKYFSSSVGLLNHLGVFSHPNENRKSFLRFSRFIIHLQTWSSNNNSPWLMAFHKATRLLSEGD